MPAFEKHRFVVGSRKSGLALWQTEHVIGLLQRAWPDVELAIRTYDTEGDTNLETALPEIGGKGVFTTRLEEALATKDIDLAVHSLKDLPVDTGRAFMIGAITSRTDARDCVVARNGWTIATLPPGAVVGTSSLRRQGQLLAQRPDLVVKPIRGNVDTRVRKVLSGDYDAALLAAAGVTRLGLAGHVTEWIPADAMLPAPGQGALAVQCRTGDRETLLRLAAIDDPGVRAAVETERAFLQHLGGGCSAPIAAYARMENGRMRMIGVVVSPDGLREVRVEGEAEDGTALALQLAERALDEGAQSILTEFRSRTSPARQPARTGVLEGRRVVVTRARADAEPLCERLAALGATPICAPAIRIEPISDLGPLDEAIARSAFDWVVFTSTDAVEIFCRRWTHAGKTPADLAGVKVAAVGPATARALQAWGRPPDFVPGEFTGDALAEGLPLVPGQRVLLPRAEIGRQETVEILERRGATVVVIPIYRTVAAKMDAAVIEDLRLGVDAVLFTSGSTVTHFMQSVRQSAPGIVFPAHARIMCIGPVTASAAREAGLRVDAVAHVHTTEGLVDALVCEFQKGAVGHAE